MSVVEATQNLLVAAEAVGTPEGEMALTLARALDSGRSLMAAPAMAKELSAQLKTIRDAAPKKGDAVDELLARREAVARDSNPSGVQRTTKRRQQRG